MTGNCKALATKSEVEKLEDRIKKLEFKLAQKIDKSEKGGIAKAASLLAVGAVTPKINELSLKQANNLRQINQAKKLFNKNVGDLNAVKARLESAYKNSTEARKLATNAGNTAKNAAKTASKASGLASKLAPLGKLLPVIGALFSIAGFAVSIASIKILGRRIDINESAIQDLNNDFSKVNSQIARTNRSVDRLNGEIKDTNARVDAVSNQLGTLSGNIRALQADIKDLEDINRFQSSEIRKLKAEADKLTNQILTTQGKVSNLQSSQNKQDSDISSLESDVSGIQSSVSTLQNSIKSFDSKLSNTANKLDSKIDEVSNQSKSKDASQDKAINGLQSNISNAIKQLESKIDSKVEGKIKPVRNTAQMAQKTAQYAQQQTTQNRGEIRKQDGVINGLNNKWEQSKKDIQNAWNEGRRAFDLSTLLRATQNLQQQQIRNVSQDAADAKRQSSDVSRRIENTRKSITRQINQSVVNTTNIIKKNVTAVINIRGTDLPPQIEKLIKQIDSTTKGLSVKLDKLQDIANKKLTPPLTKIQQQTSQINLEKAVSTGVCKELQPNKCGGEAVQNILDAISGRDDDVPFLSGVIETTDTANKPISVPYSGTGIEGIESMLLAYTGAYTQSKLIKEDVESVLSIPDSWGQRVGNDRPQLVVVYAYEKTDGTRSYWNTTIPHYTRSKSATTKALFPDYTRGNQQGRAILSDNSAIVINCSTDSEARRMLTALCRLVNKNFTIVAEKTTELRGGDIESVRVTAFKAKFYANGQQERDTKKRLAPTWEIEL